MKLSKADLEKLKTKHDEESGSRPWCDGEIELLTQLMDAGLHNRRTLVTTLAEHYPPRRTVGSVSNKMQRLNEDK